MNDNRNMILAVVLSALVLLGWGFLSNRFLPQPAETPPAAQQAAGTDAAVPAPQAQGAPAPTAAPAQLRPVDAVLGEGRRVQIDTPRLKGSINLQGARIDDLVLLNERESIDRNSAPVRLLAPAGTKDAYFATFGWTGDAIQAPNGTTVWTPSAAVLKPGQPVTLRWSNPTGQTFEIVLSVDNDYLFTAQQRVINRGSGAVAVRPYGLINRAAASVDQSSWTVHVGPIGFLDGRADYDTDWSDLGPGQAKRFDSTGGWIGFTDKYWLTALAPAGDPKLSASFTGTPSRGFQADYALGQQVVAPGRAAQTETRLFAGAKEKALLDRYEDAGITKLSKSIDWGWFEWFMRPIFDLLSWLFHATGNFGVAIIILTCIVRLIMFPIAQKQFKSFAAMRKVQPKLKVIQEKYKNDKQKQQQAMLKLYQEEKINPAAGCLPILLQIPIFYALYKVLMLSVEMRHQPFALWIKDLSAPDPLTPLNLFGLLNFTPPGFLYLGILPILLGVTMWLQFKLNPQQMDPTQQAVFKFMPWVMMFVLAPFATGLVLYWVTSNILTIAQQWWLYRRFDLHLSDTHPVKT
ncbi:membrane protein insertase YidC [Sphingomonas sabuli]|uniref:Membrane protein insertase YidC n=1 Tax=Sphingomonas sabuli TaxID=2764186 RepID=A0A7G9L2S0_9SPHN|nr:membrane protein insertase YidC [Sphingomonas sabuli]QNM82919.1 membrane protein insertase YidC [Sphingomonas sabuli]